MLYKCTFFSKKKKKMVISFVLIDGFFELYIFGFLKKMNLKGFLLQKEIDNIKYKFIYLMPFLLIYAII